MPIERPTLATLVDRISGDVQTGVGGTAPLLSRSVLQVLSRVMAGAAHLLWGYIEWLARQITPDTADAEYLEAHGATYGVLRIPATFASANVQIAGSNGITIPAGTVVISAAGQEYQSAADVTTSGGSGTIAVTASAPGAASSLATGQVLTLLQPIAGLAATGTVLSSGLTAGQDAESDEALRTRLVARIQNPPQGGSKADYIAWMMGNAAIAPTAAWAYANYGGLGKVGITFTVGGVDPIPSGPQVTAMEAYIAELAPVTATVVAFAPTKVAVDVDLTITPDTTALRTAVETALEEYFVDNGAPGATLYLSQIREVVSSVPGIVDADITDPAANVVLGSGEIARLGAVTWS